MEKHVIFIEIERKKSNLQNNLKEFINKYEKEKVKNKFKDLKITSLSIIPPPEDDICDGRNDGNILVVHHDLEDLEEIKQFSNNEEIQENVNAEHNFIYDDYYKIAEALHKIADEFGETGSYLTYIIICVHNYAPNISEIPEFYGALRRIQDWHRGAIYISTEVSEVLNDWHGILPYSIIESSGEIVSTILETFWRGNLNLAIGGERDPYAIPESVIQCINGNSILGGEAKNVGDCIYMSSCIDVITQFDLDSLPWPYIKSGSIYSLSPCLHTDQQDQEEVGEILRAMTSNRGVGTLLRLKFSHEPPVVENISSLTTDNWKKCLAEGQFELTPIIVFKGFYETVNMVVLTEGAYGDKVMLLALQDLSVCGEDIVKLVLKESMINQPKINDAEKNKVENIMSSTPAMNSLHMSVLSNLVQRLPEKMKQMLKKKDQNLTNLCQDTRCDLEGATSKEVLRHLSIAPFSPINLPSDTAQVKPEVLLDKTSWPEYQALLNSEAEKSSSFQRSGSGDLLGGLAPPTHQDSVMTINAGLFLQMFKKNGEPTNKVRAKMTKFTARGKQYPFKGSVSLKEAMERQWPEALHTRCHGIYYNFDENREKYEEKCNKLRDRYLRKDTISTCSVFMDKEAFVPVPVTKRNTRKKDSTQNKISEQRLSMRHQRLETDCGDSASVVSNALMTRSRRSMNEPLRRSPRKRTQTASSSEMKPSDLLKPSEKRPKQTQTTNKKEPIPATLSEVHRQKLRIAVVNALEKEEINLKHQMFKVCYKKLTDVCKPFALDVIGCGSTSKMLEKVANSHVKQVIEFEQLKMSKKYRK